MPVGVQIAKADIDNTLASFGRQIHSLIFQINQFALSVGTLTAAQLTTLGYSAPDQTLLSTTVADLQKFGAVFYGTWYVAPGATAGTGVPTKNDASHFGYVFDANISTIDGLGY